MLSKMILAATMPEWLSASVPYIKTTMIVLITLAAIFITIIVLKMDSIGEGNTTNSITGKQGTEQQDSFYKKNMASSKEGRLKRLIVICSITIAVLTVIYFIFSAFIDKFN